MGAKPAVHDLVRDSRPAGAAAVKEWCGANGVHWDGMPSRTQVESFNTLLTMMLGGSGSRVPYRDS